MNSIPKIIKDISVHTDYTTFYKFIHVKGIELYGPDFILFEEDAPVIAKLLIYFLQDQKMCGFNNISLQKGIMLTGPVGCGKTTLLNLMRYLLPPDKRYFIKPCREIAINYSIEGYEVIQRYTKLSFNPYNKQPIPICFDDLGLESIVQFYGNECNTMSEILLSRYDYFIQNDMFTHLTSNLSANEIQDRYGIRVRSRMREMFNLIAFDKDAVDKRK